MMLRCIKTLIYHFNTHLFYCIVELNVKIFEQCDYVSFCLCILTHTFENNVDFGIKALFSAPFARVGKTTGYSILILKYQYTINTV